MPSAVLQSLFEGITNFMAIVYLLKNPVNDVVYYVGYTEKTLTERFVSHLHSKIQPTTKLLIASGRMPTAEIIEENPEVTRQTESYWIKRLLSEGCPLENILIPADKKATIANIPIELLNTLNLSDEERLRFAMDFILKELPLSPTIPIVQRIKTICEWSLSL